MFIDFEMYFSALCEFFLDASLLFVAVCLFATYFGMPKGKRVRFFLLERCAAAAFGFGFGGMLFLALLPDFMHPLALLMSLFCSGASIATVYVSQIPRDKISPKEEKENG